MTFLDWLYLMPIVLYALAACLVALICTVIVIRHRERKAANAQGYQMWLERDPMPSDLNDRILSAIERELNTPEQP